ncbi:uncharacterized protein LOC5520708 isoform X2 [Nematostella vectensis]|uniref:uncharacterized protein LOC5520708 isoform X2 n=1 Tax=Nematostella vectensis TaxID=45351 RepID=UPI002076F678|nr:uncharacterized protein LOC5520708 isoform X2 [Nematostella vectensis]
MEGIARPDRVHPYCSTKVVLPNHLTVIISRMKQSKEEELQRYWQQICNQESASKERNYSLLQDFERVEQHASMLTDKLQRLKSIKDNYEAYVNQMYPSWREQLEHHRQMMQWEREKVQNGQGESVDEFIGRPHNQAPLHSQPWRPTNGHVRFQSPDPAQNPYLDRMSRPTYPNMGYPTNSPSQLSGYSTRAFTAEWDPYYTGDPSFNHYFPERIPRSPYYPSGGMMYSTPYHPMHSGPHDPRNGFNQSLDMSYGSAHQQTLVPGKYGPGNGGVTDSGMGMVNGGNMGQHSRGNASMDSRLPHDSEVTQGQGNALDYKDSSYGEGGSFSGTEGGRVKDNDDVNTRSQELTNSDLQAERKYVKHQPMSLDPSNIRSNNNHQSLSSSTSNVRLSNSDQIPGQYLPVLQGYGQQHISTIPGSGLNIQTQSATDKLRHDQIDGQENIRKGSLGKSNEYPSMLTMNDLQSSSESGERKGIKNKALHENSDSEIDVGSISSGLSEDGDSDITISDEAINGRRHSNEETATKGSTAGSGAVLLRSQPASSGVDDRDEMTRDGFTAVVEAEVEDLHEEEVQHQQQFGLQEQSLRQEQRKQQQQLQQQQQQKQQQQLEKKQQKQSLMEEKLSSEIEKMTLATGDGSSKEGSLMDPVSVDEFLVMLSVVDDDIEVSFSPESLYHSPACSTSMKEDIIISVGRGDSLQTYDPCTISMIVLEELPRIVTSSSSGWVISDEAFSSGQTISSDRKLRPYVEPSLSKLWITLLAHMTNIVRNGVMSTDEVTAIFAPPLLSIKSKYHQEWQALLSRLIISSLKEEPESQSSPDEPEDLPRDLDQRDANRSVTSESSSFISDAPLPDESVHSAGNGQPDPLQRTFSYEEDFEEENVPLNETAAYKKLMSSAQSDPVDDVSVILGESGPKKGESEDDDDVERTLARSISPPPLSPRQRSPVNGGNKTPENRKQSRQRPKLSLFGGGEGSLGLSYGSEELGDSWGGEDNGRLSASWKSDATEPTPRTDRTDSDSSVSPPLTPDDTPAYIPSAVTEAKKPVTSQPKEKPAAKVPKKPDFWNHSDTESEPDLQLSTGGQEAADDDDDFDFYG